MKKHGRKGPKKGPSVETESRLTIACHMKKGKILVGSAKLTQRSGLKANPIITNG